MVQEKHVKGWVERMENRRLEFLAAIDLLEMIKEFSFQYGDGGACPNESAEEKTTALMRINGSLEILIPKLQEIDDALSAIQDEMEREKPQPTPASDES